MLRVVDGFAGLGGFTCGALEAGAEVVLAIDSDPVPLKLLGANSTKTTTVVATLGPGRNEVELPPAADDLHVHFSTPCTELSIARRGPGVCLSKAIVLAARAVLKGEPAVELLLGPKSAVGQLPSTALDVTTTAKKKRQCTLVTSLAEHRRLRQRVDHLERLVLGLQRRPSNSMDSCTVED